MSAHSEQLAYIAASLRKKLKLFFIMIITGMLISYSFIDDLIIMIREDLLPTGAVLIQLSPVELIILKFKISVVAGMVPVIPILLYTVYTALKDETINRKLMEKYKNNHNPGVHSLIRPPKSEEAAVAALLSTAQRSCAGLIRPPESEEAAVAALLKKQLTLHFCHISTKNAVNLIHSAKEEGKDVTCEVTPHHLFLSAKSWKRLGSRGKMNPPLREPCHIPPLWEALNDHTIDMIASDHAPHTIEEKNTDIYDAPPGVPGVETLFPLMLEAAKHNHITLKRLIEVTRLNPAKRFGFDAHNKGDIKKGFDADIIIVDTSNTTPIRGEKLHSKAGWTPFEGTPALFPRLTLLRGMIIWDEGITVKKGYGNHCLRNASYGENDNTY
ncbi:MAG: Allantoinase [Candidatus Argoarchaeum ethanivorans]|uniref:Allantoinase n=1 Tax=Candidatus Argoarchaeum ethanivorans TaxID=2608793 RepID=A0A812A2T8_9EURY|nr:MAG: Allantoinase [Candidatus Argoarchaeum ethanivorans]